MSSIYDIDYSQQGPEILPPDKRDSNTIGLIKSLLSVFQWARDLLFGSYKIGATAPNYAAGLYNQYDMVIFEKSVYYSLIPNNTDAPTITSSWLKVQDNFLGVNERVKFNGQVLVLEYALNQRFGGTFRPPGSSSLSDIYLNNIPAVVTGFLVGEDEAYSSSVGQTLSSKTIGSPYPFIHINNFNINLLNSLYILTNEQAVRDFVDLYIPVSLRYTITPY
jgi:hypothetical protein